MEKTHRLHTGVLCGFGTKQRGGNWGMGKHCPCSEVVVVVAGEANGPFLRADILVGAPFVFSFVQTLLSSSLIPTQLQNLGTLGREKLSNYP